MQTPSGPSSTASTSGESGTIVMTTPQARPTSAGEAASVAPSAARASMAGRLRLNTVTAKPAFSRFEAMGLPISPSPITPTVSMRRVTPGTAGALRRANTAATWLKREGAQPAAKVC